MRDLACQDCVVSVLLGVPENVEIDVLEQRAIDALGRALDRNTWMAPETKAEAKAKAEALSERSLAFVLRELSRGDEPGGTSRTGLRIRDVHHRVGDGVLDAELRLVLAFGRRVVDDVPHRETVPVALVVVDVAARHRRSPAISWCSAECSESTGISCAPVASESAITSSPPTTRAYTYGRPTRTA